MKAIRYEAYGSPDVLRYKEIEKPVPADNEILVKTRAASVNAADWHFMRGAPYLVRLVAGLRKPKDTRIGIDVAGEVESVGRSVTQFRPGDEVFGVCKGAFAEYACALENKLVTKPGNVSFEQGAAVPVASLTALQGLRDKAKLQSGQTVLVNGAGGGVGTFAVQIARAFGADVTAVTTSENLDMVRAIGADHVIDYTRDDFTKNGQRYDIIFDLGGTHQLSHLIRALTREGTLLMVGAIDKGSWFGPLAGLFEVIVKKPFISQKLKTVLGRANKDDLIVMQEFLAASKVVPVIDRTYPLRDVAEAIRYLEEGHARGKVVITI